jgi:hypothetical protein
MTDQGSRDQSSRRDFLKKVSKWSMVVSGLILGAGAIGSCSGGGGGSDTYSRYSRTGYSNYSRAGYANYARGSYANYRRYVNYGAYSRQYSTSAIVYAKYINYGRYTNYGKYSRAYS